MTAAEQDVVRVAGCSSGIVLVRELSHSGHRCIPAHRAEGVLAFESEGLVSYDPYDRIERAGSGVSARGEPPMLR